MGRSRISIKKATAGGVKDTVAIALISIGVNYINSGDYLVGGGLVVVGWILLVIDKLIGE